jgi:hypothetical protein
MTETSTPATGPDDQERRRRLRQRNIAVAGVLAALFVIFYLITLYKGVPLIARRPL